MRSKIIPVALSICMLCTSVPVYAKDKSPMDKEYTTTMDEPITISVDNALYTVNRPDKALVETTGKIYPIGVGKVKLTAQVDKKKYKTKIDISEGAGVLNHVELHGAVGKTIKVANTEVSEIEVASGDIDKLAVRGKKVKGLKSGVAHVMYQSGSMNGVVNVYIRPKKVSMDTINIGVGDTIRIPIGKYLYRNPQYKSSKKKVASVDALGRITGLKAGVSKIAVKDRGIISKFKVIVSDPMSRDEADYLYTWDKQRMTPTQTLYFNKFGDYVCSQEEADAATERYAAARRTVTLDVSPLAGVATVYVNGGRVEGSETTVKLGDTVRIAYDVGTEITVNNKKHSAITATFKITNVKAGASIKLQPTAYTFTAVSYEDSYDEIPSVFIMKGTQVVGLTDYGKTLNPIALPEETTSVSVNAFDGYPEKRILLPNGVSRSVLPDGYEHLTDGTYAKTFKSGDLTYIVDDATTCTVISATPKSPINIPTTIDKYTNVKFLDTAFAECKHCTCRLENPKMNLPFKPVLIPGSNPKEYYISFQSDTGVWVYYDKSGTLQMYKADANLCTVTVYLDKTQDHTAQSLEKYTYKAYEGSHPYAPLDIPEKENYSIALYADENFTTPINRNTKVKDNLALYACYKDADDKAPVKVITTYESIDLDTGDTLSWHDEATYVDMPIGEDCEIPCPADERYYEIPELQTINVKEDWDNNKSANVVYYKCPVRSYTLTVTCDDPNANATTGEFKYKVEQRYTVHGTATSGYDCYIAGIQTNSYKNAMPAHNVTIAVTAQTESYPINYLLNGGLFGEDVSVPISYTVEDAFTIPTPTKPYSKFKGWRVNNNEPVMTYEITAGSLGELELEAVWEEQTVTLTLDPGVGSVNDTTINYKVSEGCTIPSPTVPKGYTFQGWYSDNGQRYTSIPSGVEVTKLTARYATHRYSLTCYTGDTIYYSKSVVYGGVGTNEPVVEPERVNNMMFTGWNTKADGTGVTLTNEQVNKFDYTEVDNATVDLYAQYTECEIHVLLYNKPYTSDVILKDAPALQELGFKDAVRVSKNFTYVDEFGTKHTDGQLYMLRPISDDGVIAPSGADTNEGFYAMKYVDDVIAPALEAYVTPERVQNMSMVKLGEHYELLPSMANRVFLPRVDMTLPDGTKTLRGYWEPVHQNVSAEQEDAACYYYYNGSDDEEVASANYPICPMFVLTGKSSAGVGGATITPGQSSSFTPLTHIANGNFSKVTGWYSKVTNHVFTAGVPIDKETLLDEAVYGDTAGYVELYPIVTNSVKLMRFDTGIHPLYGGEAVQLCTYVLTGNSPIHINTLQKVPDGKSSMVGWRCGSNTYDVSFEYNPSNLDDCGVVTLHAIYPTVTWDLDTLSDIIPVYNTSDAAGLSIINLPVNYMMPGWEVESVYPVYLADTDGNKISNDIRCIEMKSLAIRNHVRWDITTMFDGDKRYNAVKILNADTNELMNASKFGLN